MWKTLLSAAALFSSRTWINTYLSVLSSRPSSCCCFSDFHPDQRGFVWSINRTSADTQAAAATSCSSRLWRGDISGFLEEVINQDRRVMWWFCRSDTILNYNSDLQKLAFTSNGSSAPAPFSCDGQQHHGGHTLSLYVQYHDVHEGNETLWLTLSVTSAKHLSSNSLSVNQI